MGIKKGTKLTDTPKDYILRVRMDKTTLAMLDAICMIADEEGKVKWGRKDETRIRSPV